MKSGDIDLTRLKIAAPWIMSGESRNLLDLAKPIYQMMTKCMCLKRALYTSGEFYLRTSNRTSSEDVVAST